VVDLNYFCFSLPKSNPNPTHLPKHETNNQFYQCIRYVEHYSVHAHMVRRQKFRLITDPVHHCFIRQRCARTGLDRTRSGLNPILAGTGLDRTAILSKLANRSGSDRGIFVVVLM